MCYTPVATIYSFYLKSYTRSKSSTNRYYLYDDGYQIQMYKHCIPTKLMHHNKRYEKII